MGFVYSEDEKGFTCQECQRRSKCQSPCPPISWALQLAEVEPSKERPVDPNVISRMGNGSPFDDQNSTTEIIFRMFFFDHVPAKEIAKQLYKSQSYVYSEIDKAKKKIIENLRK